MHGAVCQVCPPHLLPDFYITQRDRAIDDRESETVVNPEREVKEVSYPPSKAQCNGVKS